MTQLPDSITKSDLPLNHYANRKELVHKHVGCSTASATSTSSPCSSTSSETSASTSASSSTDMSSISTTANKSSRLSPTACNSSDKAVIPLPPPPLGSLAIGNAYGGNQSYLGLKDPELSKFGSSGRPSSPEMLDGAFSTNNSSRQPGVVGLHNLGNTCFMNSGLQCLINTSPVVEFFLKSGTSPPKLALTLQFQNLIRNSWHGPAPTIYPREFKETLGNVYSQFKDCRQHDCQEFLALTLDELHEQLKVWNNAKKGNTNETSSSGFASGPVDSESSSTVNESDVSSSLQSPGSNGDCESQVTDGSPSTKKRRLTDENDVTMHLTNQNSSLVKEESSVDCENGPTLGDVGMVTDEEVDVESEGDVLEDVGDGDKLTLRAKAKQAEGFWMNYIRDNNTVIASSFQGMYKSTVTCSVCDYVSCTYEPFMYLSLPIPRTSERQFEVNFSSTADFHINKANVTMNVGDSVGKLKEKVVTQVFQEMQLGIPGSAGSARFVVAEIVNYQIHSILKDDQPLKNIRDGIHNVYVLELNQNFSDSCDSNVFGDIQDSDDFQPLPFQQPGFPRPSTYLDEDWENETSAQTPTVIQSTSSSGGGFIPPSEENVTGDAGFPNQPSFSDMDTTCKQENVDCSELLPCSVCLEDLPKSKLRQHYGCSCILCSECITKTAECLKSSEMGDKAADDKTPSPNLKCPVCSDIVDYQKCFIPLMSLNDGCSKKLNVIPLLLRHDPDKDSNNNSSVVTRLIGHPLIIQLPSSLPAAEFHEFIKRVNPLPDQDFRVINASWNGKECGNCIYSRSCKGCEYPSEGLISINSRNSVVISYSNLSPDIVSLIEPNDMKILTTSYSPWNSSSYREEPIIDIHECLDAFSEIEYLDDQNPWFCPGCKKNQCATKSLTICRFPDYLIVYLKRFVFMDHSSNKLNNKLKFPINDFDVSKYIAEEFAGGQHIYDLYSCVCHFGTASGGHYTAFSKNPKLETWHNFNDNTVTSKSPSEDEFASAYVLFYAKKGLKTDIPLRRMQQSQLRSFSILGSSGALKEVGGLNECDTTSTLPDCSLDGSGDGSYGIENGPQSLCEVSLATAPGGNQEDEISSTSMEHSDDGVFGHKSGLNPASVSQNQFHSAVSDKLNSVSKNVSNLSIDVVDSNNYPRKQRGRFTSSGETATSTNTVDQFDDEFGDVGTIKPYAEFSIENKRLTKVASRSKISSATHAPASFTGSRKQ